tara:strand:+ start:5008 stop:5997 length:990 start_codon:yes stop_codon:yes gene_type:complete
MKIYPYLCGILLIFFLFSSITALSAEKNFSLSQKVKILLPQTSVINSDEYTLGEIAQIEGENILLLDKLSEISIGRSPLPGRKLTVTKSLIFSRLRSKGINIKHLIFPGFDTTVIQRAALKISGSDIEQVVLKHIRDTNKNLDLKPRLLAKTRDIYLPRGQVSYVISSKGKYKKEGGYRNYDVEFSINGKPTRKISVRTYLKIYKEVYVARDTIKREQLIEESDLLKIRRNIDRMPREYVTDKEKLIGKITKRTINPSEAINFNTVTTPPLVKSGDRIQIVYETPFLRLSAPGISLSKGRKGERIPVKNSDSKLVVFATVKTRNIVQVN